MKTAKLLREHYEDALKNLQDRCDHPHSIWVEEQWALGHTTGRSLKMCSVCDKTLEIAGGTPEIAG